MLASLLFVSLHLRQVTLFHKGSFTNYVISLGGKGGYRKMTKEYERWRKVGGGAEDDVIFFKTKIRKLLKKWSLHLYVLNIWTVNDNHTQFPKFELLYFKKINPSVHLCFSLKIFTQYQFKFAIHIFLFLSNKSLDITNTVIFASFY